MTRGIIVGVCALSLASIFLGAPYLGYQITGASLFVYGFGWTKLLFAAGAVCSLLMVLYRRRQQASRASEAVSLVLHLLSFSYGAIISTMAVVQSDYPFEHNQVGFLANMLSSLGYLFLGLLIWAFAGWLARR